MPALLLLALGLFCLGVWNLARHRRLTKSWMHVPGTTLEPLVEETDESVYYVPRFEYFVEGHRHLGKGQKSSCRRCSRANRIVSVYYPPGRPHEGKIVQPWLPLAYTVPIGLAAYLLLVHICSNSTQA